MDTKAMMHIYAKAGGRGTGDPRYLRNRPAKATSEATGALSDRSKILPKQTDVTARRYPRARLLT